MADPLRVVAIVAAFNEEDVVGEVVEALIDDGVQVYFIDHQSTDRTASVVRACVGKGVIAVESLAGGDGVAEHRFTWEAILKRKETLARELDADWFIHHDADEFRESPWPGETLLEGIRRVDAAGYNAIDFQVLNFRPTGRDRQRAHSVRARMQYYEPGGTWDRVQIKCWKKGRHPAAISLSGGHSAEFPDRRIFPVRFILRHYPIRSQAHGERKVFRERQPSFVAEERARGWHVQYDDLKPGASFVCDADALVKFDPEAVRLEAFLHHRGVERLQQVLAANQDLADRLTGDRVALQAHLDRLDAEIAQLRSDRERETGEATRLQFHLRSQDEDLARLRAAWEALLSDAAALRQHLQAQDAELAGLRSEREALVGDIAALRTTVASGETEAARLSAHLAAQDAEMSALRRLHQDDAAELDKLSSHLQSQDQEVTYLRGERERLTGSVASLNEAIAALSTRERELAGDIDRVQALRSELVADVTTLRSRLDAAQAATAHLLASRSWKLTRPLRAVEGWFGEK